MRDEVQRLSAMPQMVDKHYPGQEDLDSLKATLVSLSAPLTESEALLLVGLLPDDDSAFYGFAWTLLHLIESAGTGVVMELRSRPHLGWWGRYLIERSDIRGRAAAGPGPRRC